MKFKCVSIVQDELFAEQKGTGRSVGLKVCAIFGELER